MFEMTRPRPSPDLLEYMHSLMIRDRATMSASGKLIVDGDLIIPSDAIAFKFPFESVSGDLVCSDVQMTSFAGAPHTVGCSVYCLYTRIESFEHAPMSVGGDFFSRGSSIKSLKGIHKTHRNWKIGGVLGIPTHTADIVGLALIEGINRVKITTHTFDISDHDPHSFQEKLLDAGLKAQARM